MEWGIWQGCKQASLRICSYSSCLLLLDRLLEDACFIVYEDEERRYELMLAYTTSKDNQYIWIHIMKHFPAFNILEHIFFPHPICCLTYSDLSSCGVRLRSVLIATDDKLILSLGLGVKILFDRPLINAAARLCSELIVSVILVRRCLESSFFSMPWYILVSSVRPPGFPLQQSLST